LIILSVINKETSKPMAKDILRNDIEEVLGMICEQYTIISKYEDRIPQIEMDIIMSNIRRLYDDFFELNKHNRACKATAETREIKEEKSAEEGFFKIVTVEHPARPIIKEPPGEKKEKPIENIKQEEPPVVIKVEEPKIKPQEIVKPKEPAKQQQKKNPAADLFSDANGVILSEKFKDDKKTLHDKIASEKKEKTLADKIQNPISDLRTGIGVNDRFLLINALFKGSMPDYSAAIEEINKQESLDDAVQIISIFTEQYRWDEKSEGFLRLMGFVNRRFR
jgi:hypothetical protein